MGVISADVTVRSEPVLTERDVSLLTCAMSHILIEEDHLTDPYFTEDEWKEVVKRRTRDLDDAKHLLCEDIPIEDRRGFVAQKNSELPLCNCMVHVDDEKY